MRKGISNLIPIVIVGGLLLLASSGKLFAVYFRENCEQARTEDECISRNYEYTYGYCIPSYGNDAMCVGLSESACYNKCVQLYGTPVTTTVPPPPPSDYWFADNLGRDYRYWCTHIVNGQTVEDNWYDCSEKVRCDYSKGTAKKVSSEQACIDYCCPSGEVVCGNQGDRCGWGYPDCCPSYECYLGTCRVPPVTTTPIVTCTDPSGNKLQVGQNYQVCELNWLGQSTGHTLKYTCQSDGTFKREDLGCTGCGGVSCEVTCTDPSGNILQVGENYQICETDWLGKSTGRTLKYTCQSDGTFKKEDLGFTGCGMKICESQGNKYEEGTWRCDKVSTNQMDCEECQEDGTWSQTVYHWCTATVKDEVVYRNTKTEAMYAICPGIIVPDVLCAKQFEKCYRVPATGLMLKKCCGTDMICNFQNDLKAEGLCMFTTEHGTGVDDPSIPDHCVGEDCENYVGGPGASGCNEDSDCAEGHFCVNGICEWGEEGSTCKDDSDCKKGFECVWTPAGHVCKEIKDPLKRLLHDYPWLLIVVPATVGYMYPKDRRKKEKGLIIGAVVGGVIYYIYQLPEWVGWLAGFGIVGGLAVFFWLGGGALIMYWITSRRR